MRAAASRPVSYRHIQGDPVRLYRPANLVVTYHYIRERPSDGVTGVSLRQFSVDLEAISRHYRVVTVEEYVALHESETGLALITFDDAVSSQALAVEVLDERGWPGVFFVPMRPYSEEADRWCPQHLLHALADELGWEELERRVRSLVGEPVVDFEEMNRLYHYEAGRKRWLKYVLAFALSPRDALEALRRVNAGVGVEAEAWYVSAQFLRQMQCRGHALGGHGFDHMPYTTLSARDQAADVYRATTTLNAQFGAMSRTFAYPFGRYNKTTQALVRGCGYTFAFTTQNRVDAKFLGESLGAADCA
jgi:peptidoglycan/xylan/chitin deacetylase (PgdA/CDA1 family)